MNCAVIQDYGADVSNLAFQDREDPVATGENIRVRVSATALNRADLLQRRGLYPAPPGISPDVPGLEFVGIVDQLGESVTEWKGGERVFGIVAGGAYAEKVVTHQRLAVAVPEEIPDVEAAAIPEAFIAAHDALVTQGRMQSGDIVLVHAVAGGVGTAALQLAELCGARAIGTAGSREKLEAVAMVAPFFPINYKEEDFQEAVEREFGRDAVDMVLDTVGASHWQRNIYLLRPQGRLILLGLLGGGIAETPLGVLLTKRIRIMGTVLRSRPLEERILATQAFAHQLLPHLGSRRLRAVVDSVFPFHQLHEATTRMEQNQNVGKIVLRLS
jgi:putative PIG3 family NAD(P)H quinone oxidoreductase